MAEVAAAAVVFAPEAGRGGVSSSRSPAKEYSRARTLEAAFLNMMVMNAIRGNRILPIFTFPSLSLCFS